MTSRLAACAAAAALASLIAVGMPTSALAQQGEPGQGSERCSAAGGGPGNAPGNSPEYPPGRGPAISDSNAERGQRMSASSGCSEFAPGQSVSYGVESVFQLLGSVVATAGGEATVAFNVPTNLSNGRHHVVFRGLGVNGVMNEVRVPFTVAGGPTAAAPGGGAGQGAGGGTISVGGVNLPRTGSDTVVPLALLGGTMVAAGAGAVVASRRRRSDAIA